MPALIRAMRAAWSATPGTTPADAAFGLVTLSTDDSEGATDMASFRWAQTANYGVAPNAAMPNVFVAQAYDLADPWVNCGDAPQTKQCPGCDTALPGVSCLTPFYMGPGIHPRLKAPVGGRLAAGAFATVYGFGGPVTGPTLAGCAISADGASLTLTFNATLLAGAALTVAPAPAAYSGLSVLVNSTGIPATGKWIAVPVALGSATTVIADLSKLGSSPPQAVKYAWGATGGVPNDVDVTCCAPQPSGVCAPVSCPINAVVPTAPYGLLPANPWIAVLRAGGCECAPPQTCDA